MALSSAKKSTDPLLPQDPLTNDHTPTSVDIAHTALAYQHHFHPVWSLWLEDTFKDPRWQELLQKLHHYEKQGNTVYPPAHQRFRVFEQDPRQVRVVILGQDPYHGRSQANGLSFSVNKGITVPPSLRNIYQELKADIPTTSPTTGAHGDLTHWSSQGVLLLNSMLSVTAGAAGSHKGLGWEWFTDACIRALATHREHLVFILWGKFAQSKAELVQASPHAHKVLASAHPSPYSASAGFFGSKPFSQANQYLAAHGVTPIDWSVPD